MPWRRNGASEGVDVMAAIFHNIEIQTEVLVLEKRGGQGTSPIQALREAVRRMCHRRAACLRPSRDGAALPPAVSSSRLVPPTQSALVERSSSTPSPA